MKKRKQTSIRVIDAIRVIDVIYVTEAIRLILAIIAIADLLRKGKTCQTFKTHI